MKPKKDKDNILKNLQDILERSQKLQREAQEDLKRILGPFYEEFTSKEKSLLKQRQGKLNTVKASKNAPFN